jgi:phage/plasmid-like protein (TIGR03299 family)
MKYSIGQFGTYVGDQNLTSAELIKQAKLDTTVSLYNVFTDVGLDHIRAENYKAVVRDSDNKIYAIVGNGFVPVQNDEAFEFMDAAANQNIVQYHTVGSIDDGAKVFLLSQFGEFVVGDEIYDKHIMLCNAHDGSGCLKCAFALIRRKTATIIPACDKSEYIKLRHTKNIKARMHSAEYVLAEAVEVFNKIEIISGKLYNKTVSNEEAEAIIRKIVAKEKEVISTRTSNIIASISEYYNAEAKANCWSLFNAFAEYLIHNRSARGELKEEARFDSCLFGSSADMMLRATYYLLEY